MDRIDLQSPQMQIKAWDLANWDRSNQAQRMAFLREVSLTAGLDPRMATFVVSILKAHQVKPRDYRKQASVILSWVQDNIYYINEPRERLQDPLYTLQVGYGDCDDMVLLLGAMYTAINLQFRFVLSGRNRGKLERWIEGQPMKQGNWNHIYLMVGIPPFEPKEWLFVEPTVKVPLGWDIVQAKGKIPMPELGNVGMYGGDEEEMYTLDEDGNYITTDIGQQGVLSALFSNLKEDLRPTKVLSIAISGAIIFILRDYFTTQIRDILD